MKTKARRFAFGVSLETDNTTGQVMAAYLKVRDGKSASVREYADGKAFADYDNCGNLLGIELLAPCSAKVLDKIARQAPARRYVRNAVPAGMLVPAG
jgi:uncharacterized protein YuzE